MKTATNIGGNNLALFLQSATELRMADLYTITLKNGTVLRYTTWDTSVVVSGNTFQTGPPHIKRSHIEEKTGLDVSAIDLEISAGAADLLAGPNIPILQAIATGMFDGATVRIDRLFTDSNGAQIGTVIRFSGFLGEVDEVGRSSAKLSIHALTELLTQQLPNIILQPSCTNTLFDARCGLIKSNLLQFSEDFTNTAWTLQNSASVNANAAANPLTGNTTADEVTLPTGFLSRIFQTVAGLANQNVTFSVWMKSNTGSNQSVTLFLREQSFGTTYATANITVTTNWQRFSVTGAIPNTSTGVMCLFYHSSTALPTWDVFMWGAQLEVGSVPTTYGSTASTTAVLGTTEPLTIQAGSTVNKLLSNSLKASSYYDNGHILFTSGVNAGLTKAVKQYFQPQFVFNSPLPFVPSAGDTFIAYPGCDKTQATCTSKFNNLANFEGFPYIPSPETAI